MNAHPLPGLDQPTRERVEAIPESKIPSVISTLEYRFAMPVSRNTKARQALFDSMGEGEFGYLLGWALALRILGIDFPEDLA